MMRILKDYGLILVLSALVLILLACQLDYLRLPTNPSPTPTRVATRAATAGVRPVLPTAPPPTAPVVVIPTQPPAPVSVTATDNLRVRAAPSTSAAVVDRLNKGASAQAIGRTAAGDWLQIILPTNASRQGWVSAEFVSASAPLDTLPVVQPQGTNPPVPPAPGQPYPYP